MCRSLLALNVVVALGACGESDPDTSPNTDAPPATVKFDIAYVDELRLDPNARGITSVLGFVLVVNTGTAPLDLSTASVVSVSDDSDEVAWSLTKFSGSTDVVAPGHASGCLSPSAVDKIIHAGLVTEPGGGCGDYDEGLDFEMHLPNPASPGTTYHAEATIGIDGVDIVVPFTIHTNPDNGASGLVLDGVDRISTHP